MELPAISKPEIDLDPAINPYDQAVYAKAAENLKRMVAAGVLMRDATPCYYVYRLTWRGHTQTGLACVASLADYATNRIRKHELTTPVKEDDRVRQIEAVNAQTGPVMIGYPNAPAIDAHAGESRHRPSPTVDVTADDGVRHQLWVVSDDAAIDALTRAFDALPAIYIADGHHRSAAAARVAARAQGRRLAQLFPVGAVPRTRDDHPRLQSRGEGSERPQRPSSSSPSCARASRSPRRTSRSGRPHRTNTACISPAAGTSSRCAPISSRDDPIGRLPITLLTRNVIEPLLGITDPRTDKRIDFVGGARGLEGLEARVRSGEMAVAFALYPTQMADLMAVADAGGIMPPKSTWFEPKLADGMVNHVLD